MAKAIDVSMRRADSLADVRAREQASSDSLALSRAGVPVGRPVPKSAGSPFQIKLWADSTRHLVLDWAGDSLYYEGNIPPSLGAKIFLSWVAAELEGTASAIPHEESHGITIADTVRHPSED